LSVQIDLKNHILATNKQLIIVYVSKKVHQRFPVMYHI